MIEKPSAAPTCTVIPATRRFRDGAGEGGWESVRSGESGSFGRQVGDNRTGRIKQLRAAYVGRGARAARVHKGDRTRHESSGTRASTPVQDRMSSMTADEKDERPFRPISPLPSTAPTLDFRGL